MATKTARRLVASMTAEEKVALMARGQPKPEGWTDAFIESQWISAGGNFPNVEVEPEAAEVQPEAPEVEPAAP
eukprot:7065719-Prorocentrum_lima.AAC.1